MSYLLFLDDLRVPTQVSWVRLPRGNWVIARNYRQFVERIETLGLPHFISFDHDLGMAHNGHDCAKWLVNYCLDNEESLPEFEVHSTNPVGAVNISQFLLAARRAMASND